MAQHKETVVNVSGADTVLEIATAPGTPPERHRLAPGASVEVASAYARRPQVEGRDAQPSIVEKLTGGAVVPAGDPRAQQHLARKETASRKG